MKTVLSWDERPQELSALVNPAFGALLLNAASIGHIRQTELGLPFLATFFVLPMVLHKDTRMSLPRTLRVKMHSWVADHGEIKVGFPVRARSMVPYTREALAFGVQSGVLTIGKDGMVYGRKVSTSKTKWLKEDEPNECLRKSEFLGRWLGDASDLSAIFVMWGIRP